MAVNYAEKYAEVIDEKFAAESLTESAVNHDYDFKGVNKVNVYSIPTVPLQDYDMDAPTNRYGTPVELGSEVQTLELTQDKAFSFTIDRRNNTDTQMAINSARAFAADQGSHYPHCGQIQDCKVGIRRDGLPRQGGSDHQRQRLFLLP